MTTMIPTIDYIKSLSYTDFVGEINQWNTLPGAYSTISKWIAFSRMTSDSYYLDAACTTGIKSRTVSELTGCRSVGIDISQKSIDSAILNVQKFTSNAQASYLCKDATEFFPEEKFSHISFGASLRFFRDPEKMIRHLVEHLLIDGGYLLVSEFFVTKPIPHDVCEKFHSIFDIYPTNIEYKEVMKLYSGFEVIYEDRNELVQETPEELFHYCDSTVKRYFEDRGIEFSQELYQCIYDRLFAIKEMSNMLRPYQNFNVMVLRFRKAIYPRRYVELF